jgi:hypothetical protein
LESHARISQAEGHAGKLKQPERRRDGCFRYVGGGDGHLQVTFPQVDLAEDDTPV